MADTGILAGTAGNNPRKLLKNAYYIEAFTS